jgi:rhodanese-related sulfurtransferase
VAQGLVVGIFAGSDPAAIEGALSAQKLDLSKVKVIRAATAADLPAEETELDFIDVAASMESNSLSDDMTKGMGIMGDSGGTGVPMGRSSATLGSFNSRAGASKDYLVGLNVPSDEADNFNEAIEAGRSVIAYPDAGAQADAVAASFRAAGLRNVRIY